VGVVEERDPDFELFHRRPPGRLRTVPEPFQDPDDRQGRVGGAVADSASRGIVEEAVEIPLEGRHDHLPGLGVDRDPGEPSHGVDRLFRRADGPSGVDQPPPEAQERRRRHRPDRPGPWPDHAGLSGSPSLGGAVVESTGGHQPFTNL
jgi:hypothetical protein